MDEKDLKESDIILYTTKDIQRIFGCCKEKTYQIIHLSGFPKIQIGREYYVPKDKFEKWLNGHVGKSITIEYKRIL